MLASSKATVAPCPLVHARRGIRLESFQRYLDAGVNVTLGIDTYPRDIISEMRLASFLSKIVDQGYVSATRLTQAVTVSQLRTGGREDDPDA